MLEFVIWSFTVAFTPLALHLGITLIKAVSELLHTTLAPLETSPGLLASSSSGVKAASTETLWGSGCFRRPS